MRNEELSFLAWAFLSLASLGAPVIALRRHGWRGGRSAIFAPLGALMSFGLVAAGTEYTGHPFPKNVDRLMLLAILGVFGVVVHVVSWRAAFRKAIPPGHCKKCGYDLKDLAKCPECGTASLDAPLTVSDRTACDPGGPSREGQKSGKEQAGAAHR